MPKENSAVEILLDKINDLARRIELLEERVLHPTYTNITQTPTITATRGSYTDLWPHPTIWGTPIMHEPYWASIADMYESRLSSIERELQQRAEEANQYRFEVWNNGNIYITGVNENATDEN